MAEFDATVLILYQISQTYLKFRRSIDLIELMRGVSEGSGDPVLRYDLSKLKGHGLIERWLFGRC
jgi:hypothetical protein